MKFKLPEVVFASVATISLTQASAFSIENTLKTEKQDTITQLNLDREKNTNPFSNILDYWILLQNTRVSNTTLENALTLSQEVTQNVKMTKDSNQTIERSVGFSGSVIEVDRTIEISTAGFECNPTTLNLQSFNNRTEQELFAGCKNVETVKRIVYPNESYITNINSSGRIIYTAR